MTIDTGSIDQIVAAQENLKTKFDIWVSENLVNVEVTDVHYLAFAAGYRQAATDRGERWVGEVSR